MGYWVSLGSAVTIVTCAPQRGYLGLGGQRDDPAVGLGEQVTPFVQMVKPLHIPAVDYAGCYQRKSKQWYAAND